LYCRLRRPSVLPGCFLRLPRSVHLDPLLLPKRHPCCCRPLSAPFPPQSFLPPLPPDRREAQTGKQLRQPRSEALRRPTLRRSLSSSFFPFRHCSRNPWVPPVPALLLRTSGRSGPPRVTDFHNFHKTYPILPDFISAAALPPQILL